ncbi:MAG: DUF937 domain-containing protein [Gemmatimonadetes bacterium]|nr:DUF937 domain-containing protein [Gemmatimonadota bacterium]MBT8405652.1 DUF937 domain-containing protein [Gemmatimonadota bacterium]NNF39496.1 DUF937 domain-containing protein [Gemmatimonadota bacterium]
MNFLKNLLGDSASGLVSSLVSKAGFTADEAQAFVPEATTSVVGAVKTTGDIDLSNLGAAAQKVMGDIDVPALAKRAGIGPDQAQGGLTAIVPTLLQIIQEKAGGAGGLMSMLGGVTQGGGGMLGGLGKMLGKD